MQTPPEPKPPDWPANDLPAAASVVWNSQGLLIVASNSSLAQILKEVATNTGVKVEGMDLDERVFGTYGPGPARDVLAQLLDGSNYNVVMIGDRGQGTPRRVVLSMRSGSGAPQRNGTAAPAATNDDDNDNNDQQADEPAEQPVPVPVPNGAAPPIPVRPQDQLLQERQRQIQQQPPIPPPPQN